MFTLNLEVNSCRECPKLKKGRTFGNDGRDGVLVYICSEGAFGGDDGWGYSTGLKVAPKDIPTDCPYLNKDKEV